MSRDKEERLLLHGLIVDKHKGLYLHNAWFKQALDTFVRFLPYFVDGLAADAQKQDEKFHADLERIANRITGRSV